jgi:hypothetical protein
MHYALLSLILGLIFGVLGGLFVFLSTKEFRGPVLIVSGGAFLAVFLVSLLMLWTALPLFITIIVVAMLGAGIGGFFLTRFFGGEFRYLRGSTEKLIALVICTIFILAPTIFIIDTAFMRKFDQAKYFDEQLIFSDEAQPFQGLITGDHLRVVDKDLARELIQKSSPFGSNSMILELHIGRVNNQLMWVASIGTDSIQVGTDNAGRKRNTVFGFVGVDLTDPSEEPIVIEQTFTIGSGLARSKKLERVIWKINPNYLLGDNDYYSMNEEGEMRLLVPYAISQSLKFESEFDIGMSSYLQKVGGVLEFNSDGNLIKDYRDLSELPSYARIQCYPEYWLEYNIAVWGRHRKGNHEFAYFFRTSEQLGIDEYDDIRVVYDANTDETSQYVMLTQPDSESNLLRGAIKANASGIYFFDWSNLEPKPIDTYSALLHSQTAIDQEIGTTTHNYYGILPLLFPVRNTFNNITDFAYVVPLQFEEIRFGGIAITNPFKPSGEETVVEIAETGDTVESVLQRAINAYLIMISDPGSGTEDYVETLVIDEITSFEKDGNTIYVANGNFTYISLEEDDPILIESNIWFTQNYLNMTQWQQVIFLKPGDTVEFQMIEVDGIFYCQEIIGIT